MKHASLAGTIAAALAATVLVAGCSTSSGGASSTPASAAVSRTSVTSSSASLAASSSSATTGSSTSPGSASTSASSSTPASSTSSATSAATVSSSSPTASSPAASSPDGGAGTVYGQTAAWFDTFCTGMAAFGGLSSGPEPASPQEFGDRMTTIGTSFTDTAAKLSSLPPPTFEGGEHMAQELTTNMRAAGPVFTEYGRRAATLDADDEAAGQQFLAEFQGAVGALDVTQFQPPAAAKAAVQQVPACDALGR